MKNYFLFCVSCVVVLAGVSVDASERRPANTKELCQKVDEWMKEVRAFTLNEYDQAQAPVVYASLQCKKNALVGRLKQRQRLALLNKMVEIHWGKMQQRIMSELMDANDDQELDACAMYRELRKNAEQIAQANSNVVS
jgi:hypothetical protein